MVSTSRTASARFIPAGSSLEPAPHFEITLSARVKGHALLDQEGWHQGVLDLGQHDGEGLALARAAPQ